METRWWADEDVEATGHQWAWPLILDAIKAGNGVASARALSDDRLSRCAGLDRILALDDVMVVTEFSRVGLIVAADGGWTARSWDEYQRADEAKRDRQKRYRDRKKSDVTATSRDVTATLPGRNGDVAATATVHDIQDIQDKTGGVGVADTPREDKAPAEPSPTPAPRPATPTNEPDLRAACDAYQRAMPPGRNGGVAVFMPPALVESIRSIAVDFGARMVIDAVNASVEAKGHVPGPTYVRRICERLRADERRPVALPFKAAAPQVEEPMSEDEKQASLARLMSLEI